MSKKENLKGNISNRLECDWKLSSKVVIIEVQLEIVSSLETVFNLPKESFAAKKLVHFLAHHTVLCADQ